MARDGCKFHMRIDNCEEILNPILDTNNKNKIYKERIISLSTLE